MEPNPGHLLLTKQVKSIVDYTSSGLNQMILLWWRGEKGLEFCQDSDENSDMEVRSSQNLGRYCVSSFAIYNYCLLALF